MTHEAIALWTETSSDPELIAGVRAGDATAFGVLYERHVDAARKVAAQYTNSATDVDDVVSESFSRVLRALQRGDGPDLAFRAYLFTIVRRTGMDIIKGGNRTRPGDDMGQYEAALGYEAPSDEGAFDGFEHGVVAQAFRSLPERWQAVLWYTEVEKKSPKEIAPLLGLTANGVAALAYRAREALRQAYLQQHLNTVESLECLAASAQLGAYVRGGLAKREHAKVQDHVESCDRCSDLVAELEDVNRGMRGIIAPLVLGAIGVGALEGGLPIGGVFGAGSAAGAASGANGAGGGAAGAGAAGMGAAGTGLAAWIASAGSVVLPAAAAIGIVALAVSGASYFGVFNSLGDDPANAPVANPPVATPTPTPTQSPSANPTPEPSTAPSVTPSPEPSASPSPTTPHGSGGTLAGGTTGGGSHGGTGGGTGGGTTPPAKLAALAFGAAPLDYLEISASSPTVSLTLENSGDGDAHNLTTSITLPEGLAFAAPGGGGGSSSPASAERIAAYLHFAEDNTFTTGDWTCALDDARTKASCELADLAAGATGTLSLALDPITSTTFVGDDALTEFSAASGTVKAGYKVRTGIARHDQAMQVVYAKTGHLAATQVGATVMGCDTTSDACAKVMSSTDSSDDSNLNNNGQKMVALNEAGGTANSASTSLTSAFLPNGAKVKYALLEWSANRSVKDTGWSADTSSARLRIPGGTYQSLTADSVDVTTVDGRDYYQARKDITKLVAAAGQGDYALADIALAATSKDPDPTYYGGFSITVIYELASLPSSRVALFTGTQWVSSTTPADFTFFTGSASTVTLGWTTWEGDRALRGDTVTLDGANFTPYIWPGNKLADAKVSNAADSTALGGQWANSLGVDAKNFKQESPPVGLHTIKASSVGDNYLIGSMTVTVTGAG